MTERNYASVAKKKLSQREMMLPLQKKKVLLDENRQ
jgi:hypothetical protein